MSLLEDAPLRSLLWNGSLAVLAAVVVVSGLAILWFAWKRKTRPHRFAYAGALVVGVGLALWYVFGWEATGDVEYAFRRFVGADLRHGVTYGPPYAWQDQPAPPLVDP